MIAVVSFTQFMAQLHAKAGRTVGTNSLLGAQ